MSDHPFPVVPFRVALVGAGRVATAVALLLQRRGHHIVALRSRSAASVQRAADLLEVGVGVDVLLGTADVVLIGAADAAIPAVAEEVSSELRVGSVVCHFAGSFGVEPLATCSAAGAYPLALHPVQSCPDVERAVARLPGSAWGVTCALPLERWADAFVRQELGGFPRHIAEGDRPLWHAAAAVTSNGIGALLAAGERLLDAIDVASPQEVLHPLAAGTIANAVDGAAGALTGPIVRGETATVRRHVEALRPRPDLLESYRTVARLILQTAAAGGQIGADVAAEMEMSLRVSDER